MRASRRVSRLAMGAVLLSGMAGLLLIGGRSAWVVAIGLLVCAVAPFVRGLAAEVPWPLVTLPVLAAITAGVLWGSTGDAAAMLLVYLQAHRRLVRAGPADDRLSVVIATIMLALSACFTESPAFVPILALWALSVPLSLAFAEVEGWPGRPAADFTGTVLAVGLAGVVLAGPLFLAMPREGHAPPPVARPTLTMTGFEPDVQLGDNDVIIEDSTLVVSLRTDAPGPIYLRGRVLDDFDGRRWTSSRPATPWASPAPIEGLARVEIDQQPLAEKVLFTTGDVVAVQANVPLVRDDAGGLAFEGEPQPVHATLWVRPPLGPGAAWPNTTDLATDLVTPDLDPRIAPLAEQIAGDAPGAEAKIAALRHWLLSTYEYTRTPRDGFAEDPLAVFLFDRRTGHCEYFASALAVMLRTQGVPARVVNGFAGGEWDFVAETWRFRGADAHAWVEAYVPGRGWLTVDATPGPAGPWKPPGAMAQARELFHRAWYDGVIGYDGEAQQDAILDAGATVGSLVGERTPGAGVALLALAGGVAGAASWALIRAALRWWSGERPTRRPRGKVARIHHRAHDALRRQGWEVPPALPPVAAARWVRTRAGDEAAPLEDLAWLYYRVRWGGEDDATLAADAARLLEAIERMRPPLMRG